MPAAALLKLSPPSGILLPAECLPPPEPSRIDVVQAVCGRWGVGVAAVMGKGRTRRISLTRRACSVALHRLCPSLSLGDIGAALGLSADAVLYHLEVAGVS